MTQPQPDWLATLLEEATVEFPTTPDLAPGVLAAIREDPVPQPAWGRRGWAVAIAATAVIVLVTALSIRESREAIAEFLGLAVEGERIEILPTEAPEDLPEPQDLEDFARPVGLDDIAALVGFAPALPNGDAPGAAYYLEYTDMQPEGPLGKPFVVLDYGHYHIWQSTTAGLVGKGVYLGGEVVVEPAALGDGAYWITGGPRLLVVELPGGVAIAGSERTVDANTLVWYEDDRYYRIEGDVGLDEALAIAESLR
jgi:hypothetical protein